MVKKKLYWYSNIFSLIVGIIACTLVYGPFGIVLALILQFLMAITMLLCFIPVAGLAIFVWLAWFSYIPFFLSAFGMTWEWPVTLMFIMNLVVCLGITAQALIRIFTTYWRF